MPQIPKTGDPEVDAFILILVGLVVAAIVGIRISRVLNAKIDEISSALTLVGKDAKEAKHQVKNHHGTNLRDDLDNISNRLVTIENGVQTSKISITEIRDRLDNLQAEQAIQGKKQREMEDTLSRQAEEQIEVKRDIGGMRADNRHLQTRIDRIVDNAVMKSKE